MYRTLPLLVVASALAGCANPNISHPEAGVDPVNVPVVTRQEYVVDLAAPGGSLPAQEAARLDGWFAGLDLGYGDTIYVDGNYVDGARADVAAVAGRYGLMVENGAPVTQGAVAQGNVRVVVARTRAGVPNCPNWSRPAQPNGANLSMSNLGCAINSNIAMMVANPEDLVHGREASSTIDAATASKAIRTYRSSAPTGEAGLKDVTTKESAK